MKEFHRQLVLLVGFMTLLATVFLFLFVYAPEPAEPPAFSIPLPEPLQESVNKSIQGWNDILSTFSAVNNATSSFN